jgi:hypothetical protein
MVMRSQDLAPDLLQICNGKGRGMLVRTAGSASWNQHIGAVLHGIRSRYLGIKSQLVTPDMCDDSRIEIQLMIIHVTDFQG